MTKVLQWLLLTKKKSDHKGVPNDQLVDYSQYIMPTWQWGGVAFLGIVAVFGLTYIFYQLVWLALLFSTIGVIAPRLYARSTIKKRRQQLQLQFKEALYTITSSLSAGRSVENAFRTAVADLSWLYPDQHTMIIRELKWIVTQLEHAEPLELALVRMAERTKIEEMMQFAEAIIICKRSGGNLIEVTKSTASLIAEKLTTEQEIAVLIAHKKFEARIMLAVPFLFLAFLQLVAADYMAPLYSGLGYLILTAALMLIIVSSYFIVKIMDIEL